MTLWFSFQRYNLLNPLLTGFAGLENYEFLSAVARGEQHQPGFAEAVDYVSFQAAWLRSCETGSWQDVTPLHEVAGTEA